VLPLGATSCAKRGTWTNTISGTTFGGRSPESFYQATPDELSKLGLVLFSQYARDVKHLEISGYSYISFLI